MTDTTNQTPTPDPEARGFPFVTVGATLLTLFVFLGLVVLAYNSPNYLDETKTEPKADPAAKLDEVKARNEAALEGVAAKTSLRDAHGRLVSTLKGPNDKLPFPTPEPPIPPPLPKKDEKEKKP